MTRFVWRLVTILTLRTFYGKNLVHVLCVSGRLPSGRLGVAKNERRKARLARIGKRSGVEFNHRVLRSEYREPAQAVAEGEPRYVVKRRTPRMDHKDRDT